jgi:hypothetical protein
MPLHGSSKHRSGLLNGRLPLRLVTSAVVASLAQGCCPQYPPCPPEPSDCIVFLQATYPVTQNNAGWVNLCCRNGYTGSDRVVVRENTPNPDVLRCGG